MSKSEALTISDVARMAGVTPMTVYNWRHGRTGMKPLPCLYEPAGERARVRIPKKQFLRWAQRNGIEVNLEHGK